MNIEVKAGTRKSTGFVMIIAPCTVEYRAGIRPKVRINRLIDGPSDSSNAKTTAFIAISANVENQKVWRRRLSFSGMGTMRDAF